MRFKGTLILLIGVLALGSYIYFYEIKGKEAREKAKEAENRIWQIESKDIRQIELTSSGQQIAAVRKDPADWVLTLPRQLDADSEELNSLADSASKIERESIVEENATDLEKFGLNPAQTSLRVKTKDGKEHALDFGIKNPTGDSAYASVPGQKRVMLIANRFVSAFNKKADDLRNHTVLSFDQPQTQSLSIRSPKGNIDLVKDSDDRWWFKGMDKRAADSPQVRGVLNALSMGRIKEFFNDDPDEYSNLNPEKPFAEAIVTYGKDKAIKRLIIIAEKSKLKKKGDKGKDQTSSDGTYLAKDASRPDLFFVEKDLVEKLVIPPDAMRDKALVSMQRWEIDSILLKNTKGSFSFTKSGGEWFLGEKKKKVKWDAVNGILDAMEKPVKGWVDQPSSASAYGLDKPGIRIVLKQGGDVIADCSFGKPAKDGIYAQVAGDPAIKIADPEGLAQLERNESDFVETPDTSAPKK